MNYDNVVVCGDLNANFFDHLKYNMIRILTHALTRTNDNCPTYIAENFTPSQIDFFFVKNLKSVTKFGHFPAVGISNHATIYATFKITAARKKKEKARVCYLQLQ